MKRSTRPAPTRYSPAGGISVLSAQPVGVWRTYQTYDDYLDCMNLPVANPRPGSGATVHGGILLSACIIARNEEGKMESCLDSIRSLVDEIILVDTGSTDRTREIALSFGASVFELPWNNNFSEPRNLAQHRARGEWVLSIDADETIAPFSRDVLHQLLGDEEIGGYYVRFRRRAGLTLNLQMKLYRNHPGLRHENIIHEGITPGQVRALTGRKVGRCEMLVEHSGYEGDLRHKHARNLPLLLRAIESDPEHPNKAYLWCHLADICIAQGDHAAAESAWNRGVSALRSLHRLHPAHCSVHLGLLAHLASRRQSIGPLLRKVERLYPGNLQTIWIRGCRLLDLGRYRQSIACFERLLEHGKQQDFGNWVGYDRRLFAELSYRSLSVCHARLGDTAASLEYQQFAGKRADQM